MASSDDAQFPPPLPAQPIPYLADGDAALPWMRFVRIVAAIGVVASSANLAQVMLTAMPLVGLSSIMPVGIRFTLPRLLAVIPAVLLLAGSVACLSRRPVGLRLMVIYAAVALAWAALNTTFAAVDILGRGLVLGRVGSAGYVLYLLLNAATSVAFPLTVLALMRQPPVRRIFQGR
jgi:hypothetical protein